MVNLVSFPGLGLEFTLNRVALSLFDRPIYWYGLIIALGFMLGAAISAKLAPRYGLKEDMVYDFLCYAVPASLVGARCYFVLFYLDLFQKEEGGLDWAAVFRISDGGIAIYGGILAGVATLILFCRGRKISFWALADVMTVGLILGQCIGRWGNFMNVEAYGGTTSGLFRMCSTSIANEMLAKGYVDSLGQQEILAGTLGVHPTFFYESMWNLLGLGLLLFVSKYWRKFYGQGFLLYFLWYGVGRFLIEGMRTDSLYFFGLEFMGQPLRTSQMLSLGLAVGAAGVLWLALWGKISWFSPVDTLNSQGGAVDIVVSESEADVAPNVDIARETEEKDPDTTAPPEGDS